MGLKGEKRRQKIIESATHCLLNFGDRKTTFQLIADHARVSQALVVRYLKNRENFFPMVLEFWISWAREKTEAALVNSGTAENRLRNYIRVSLDLFEKKEFAGVYLLLHSFAGVDARFKSLNSNIKRVAVERIAKILQDGIVAQEFRAFDAELVAKTIHNHLVGNVLSALTELPQEYHVKLPAALEESCLAFIRK